MAALAFSACADFKADLSFAADGYILASGKDENGQSYLAGYNSNGDFLIQWESKDGQALRVIKPKKGHTRWYYRVDNEWVLWNNPQEIESPPPGQGPTIPPVLNEPQPLK